MKQIKTLLVSLLICFFLCGFNAEAQTNINGLVLDASNKTPLAGATVFSENGKVLAITANDGSFNIAASTLPATIIIKQTGYITKTWMIKTDKGKSALFLQPDTHTLDSITVSTGYQTIAKERATGSFTKINNTVLNQQAGSNIINRLKNVTPGLQFDNNINRQPLTIRGISTYGRHICSLDRC